MTLPRLVRLALRVPLFYKIVIANAVIVIIGAVAGGLLTVQVVRAQPRSLPLDVLALLALAGVVLTVAVNALIVRIALRPLKLLEGTAARVQRGELEARAPLSPLADRELERLVVTFNGMLDSLAATRRRLRDIAARALRAEEEERKRIARELHDETAQTLAALLIRLRLLRGQRDPAGRERALEELRTQLSEALEGVRRFAQNLRPPALEELGLVPALEAHVRRLSEATGLPIRLEADELDGALSPEAELALYRIVQEALSNAVRHAHPTTIDVRLVRRPAAVEATVRDDGQGFALNDVVRRAQGGLGLFGMHERAAYVGGTVTIDTAPGRGTIVRVHLPTDATTPVPFPEP